MLENILVPLSDKFIKQEFEPQSIGEKIATTKISPNNFGNDTTIIVGFGEFADRIRTALYQLKWRFGNTKLADFGNVDASIPEAEKGFALSELVAEILEKNCHLILLGLNESECLNVYHGYRNYSEQIEIVNVSHKIELEENSVWQKILMHKPSNLFNLDFMGTQAYYISETVEGILDKLYFENHRLGIIRENLRMVEPVLRSAHAMFFNLGAMRCNDAPQCGHFSPNGLYSEEAAGIFRYAGISNKMNVVGFYGGTQQPCLITENLMSQNIWYCIDGISNRYNDHPEENHSDFIIYRNKLQSSGHELVFYKSKKSNRWWMQIPHPYEKTSHFIGCNYSDYEMVCADEMPDRWWRAYQRLM